MKLAAVDWGAIPDDVASALYAGEAERWTSLLEWDTHDRWLDLERDRRTRAATGIVAIDKTGAVRGWTHYRIANRVLTIDGLSAESDTVTAFLVDRLFSKRVLADIDRVAVWVFSSAPGLAPALRRRRLHLERYWYHGREIRRDAPPPSPRDMRWWRPEDSRPTAELLMRAYGDDAVRPFARAGTRDSWLAYVEQLTAGGLDGPAVAEACLAVPAGANALAAVALVTRVSSSAAHLAQLVVDPRFQRRGLGTSLLARVCVAAAHASYVRTTVLVGGRNTKGRRFLDSARFDVQASFLAGAVAHPLRSTSVAPGASVMTLR